MKTTTKKMSRKTVWDNLTPEEEKALSVHLRDSFGIAIGSPPWKNGSFSRVYKLDSNWLLRQTCLVRRGQEIVANAQVVYRLAGKMMPRIGNVNVFTMPESGVTIMETILEKIENIPAKEWNRVFTTPAELLMSLLEAGYNLEARGIIHRDISHNNVLLSTDGTFTFIDADDACLPDNPGMCGRPITGTSGYRLVEFDKNETALAQLIIGGRPDLAEAGVDPKTRLVRGLTAADIKYEYPEAQAEHNMVHALVILAFATITGAGDSYSFLTNYAQGKYPNIPRSWKRMLRRVCSVDPNKRLNIKQALAFPVQNVGFEFFALQKLKRRKTGHF